MNKNIAIGALIAVVVIGFGYFLLKDKTVVVDNTINTPAVKDTNSVSTTPTQTLKPDAPVVETSSNSSTSNSTASLTGKVKPNGAPTTYWFEYGDSASYGSRSTSQTIGSGYSFITTPGFISGLRANTTYYYRLSAQNKFATVNSPMYTFQTNSNVPPKVTKATLRTDQATDISRTTVALNGQVNPNGTDTNYWYEYGRDNSLGFTTQILAISGGVSFMPVPIFVSGLAPVTKYYFRLNVQNQFGIINGSILNFTTLGPVDASRPTIQTSNAKNVSSTEATLSGSINPNGDNTTYWFEYSKDSLLNKLIGTGTQQKVLSGSTNQAIQETIKGLDPNTRYYYRLVGKNQYGAPSVKVDGGIKNFTTKR